ncbi:histidine kinase [Jannaschia pagri]|uniref:histidine kinase n=1 Tax=Jannaschia pagri TaxID=2829797 RepID=A0ABQ4NN92_9RHOB|nr:MULTISPECIES: histidine kinase dimerization/phosphoacceptor domain -containing protein [unclassified Jannaschia]GIT92041.1 histidine kinase [Jannaschia sp. AI_61]GIT95875.1 histidine kinase [Jannaschia sp. AI_62]
MTSIARAWARAKGQAGRLRVRLVLLLSLAILPLGLIAVIQTATVIRDARALEERDILARTSRAVHIERAILRRAFGAADALGATAVAVGASSPACQAAMASVVNIEAAFVFAGFIGADGVMRCSSAGGTTSFSAHPEWLAFVQDPKPGASVNTNGEVSGQSVVIVTVPVEAADGILLGAVSISVPHRLTDHLLSVDGDALLLALINPDGDILAASTGIADTERFLAAGVVPSEANINSLGATYRFEAADGGEKMAAVVPLLDDRIYILGLWDPEESAFTISPFGLAAPLFPIVMWIASLLVAMLAVDRLVLRHLSVLRRRMVGFSVDDPTAEPVVLRNAPQEIESIARAYNGLTARVLRDRGVLEDNVREKEILLREVHHRVKNNLQLISSIMSMQIRAIEDTPAKTAIRRLQDRVVSLSAVHKALYADTDLETVRADKLLKEVIDDTLVVGLGLKTEFLVDSSYDRLDVDPDQAIPIALLANELVTNAVKHLGRPAEGPAQITITLGVDQDDVSLRICNTIGDQILSDPVSDGTGLGSRLIGAFVSQLGGTIVQGPTKDPGQYAVEVRFKVLRPVKATVFGPSLPQAG